MPQRRSHWLLWLMLICAGMTLGALWPAHSRQRVPPEELARLAGELEPRFGVDRNLILAVVENESGGDAAAVSEAGAVGLMQLLPGTAADLAKRHDLTNDLYDPAANMALGASYLRDLGDQFGNQPDLVIAAYHAGPGRVQGWRKAHPELSI